MQAILNFTDINSPRLIEPPDCCCLAGYVKLINTVAPNIVICLYCMKLIIIS